MTIGLIALLVLLVSWVSSIALALLVISRAGLDERLEGTPRAAHAQWLFEHLHEARLAASLLRLLLRLCLFASVLVALAGVGSEARLTWPTLAWGGAIAGGLLWIFGVVLATAIARHAAEAIVSGALPIIRFATICCMPLIRTFGFVDEAVRRLSGANLKERSGEVEAELLRRIEESQRAGGLDARAATMLENVVEFASTDVGEVMTPRTDIDGLAYTDELAEIRAFIAEVGHSRIPVYEENLDHIVGVLYVKDLIPYLGADARDFALRPLLRQPIVVPETKPVGELLADFQRSEVHLAIVVDEYGGTAGLATIEDVLEEIVGEIQDEHDPADEELPQIRQLDDGAAEVDGRFRVDDLNEAMGLELPEDEEYDTVAGFVLATLGRVPEPGEGFEAHEARFTTLESSPTHVARLRVELTRTAPTSSG